LSDGGNNGSKHCYECFGTERESKRLALFWLKGKQRVLIAVLSLKCVNVAHYGGRYFGHGYFLVLNPRLGLHSFSSRCMRQDLTPPMEWTVRARFAGRPENLAFSRTISARILSAYKDCKGIKYSPPP
jgi:hypothetical protein